MGNSNGNTMQNILSAGHKEFMEKGFRDASLRNIVKEAGVTTGAFYGYFQSKEDLFDALVGKSARILMDRFKEAQVTFACLPNEEQLEWSTEPGLYEGILTSPIIPCFPKTTYPQEEGES